MSERGGCGAFAEDMKINSPNSVMGRKLRHLPEDGKRYRKALACSAVLFLIVGLCVVCQGTYYRFSNHEGDQILKAVPTLQTVIKFAPNVSISYGVFTFVLGFAAFFAAFRPADIVLGGFCAAAGVLLLTALLVGILGCSMDSTMTEEAEAEFNLFWQFSPPPDYEARTKLQVLFKCCGLNNPQDKPGLGCDPAIKVGCKKKVMEYYTAESNKSGAIVLLVSLVDVLGIVLGLLFLKSLDTTKYKVLADNPGIGILNPLADDIHLGFAAPAHPTSSPPAAQRVPTVRPGLHGAGYPQQGPGSQQGYPQQGPGSQQGYPQQGIPGQQPGGYSPAGSMRPSSRPPSATGYPPANASRGGTAYPPSYPHSQQGMSQPPSMQGYPNQVAR